MFLKQCYKTNSLQIRDSDLKAVRGGESALAMAKRRYTTVIVNCAKDSLINLDHDLLEVVKKFGQVESNVQVKITLRWI